MIIKVEDLRPLVEAGDVSAIQTYIFTALEKGDVVAAAEANKVVLSELDSLKDTHHTTALNTFKDKQLPKLIKDAEDAKEVAVRKELAPEETADQKEIRELRELFNKEKQKSARAAVRAQLVELATGDEIGLNAAFVAKHIDKYVPVAFEIGENGEIDTTTVVEAAKTELVGLATDFKTVVTTQVEEKMKLSARTDLGGGAGGGQQTEVLLGEKLAKQSQQAQAQEKQAQFFGK